MHCRKIAVAAMWVMARGRSGRAEVGRLGYGESHRESRWRGVGGGGFGPGPLLAHFSGIYESYRPLPQKKCTYLYIYKIEHVNSGEPLRVILHEPQDWNCWAGYL